MKVARVAITTLAISATAFVGYLTKEGYTERAVIPTQGDRPTMGFGSTFKAPGVPVQMGDRTTPVEAVQRSLEHMLRDDARLKRCVTAPVHQAEYDALIDHSYQFGVAATCASSMVRLINAQRYAEACRAHLEWRKIKGTGMPPERGVIGPDGRYDCSQFVAGRPNRECWGVWTRAQKRHETCAKVNPPSLGATG